MTSAFGPRGPLKKGDGSPYVFMDGRKPLNIVIIGGSCAGLFAGILLKRQGHNVRILESASSSEREGLAAGIGLAAHVKRFFDEHDRLKDIPFGTPNDFMQIRDEDMNVTMEIPMYFRMTTWDATYYRLRANFDALKSAYCPEPPAQDSEVGEGVFETGQSVWDVVDLGEDPSGLTILTEDKGTNEYRRYKADVVVAADGANSRMRRQVEPKLQREEPGYVIWRVTVPTKDLSRNLLDKIEGKTTLYPMRHSYAIIYTIPGDNGSLQDDERVMNFAWYFWVSHRELDDILTDTDGHRHRTTLPKGKMKPEIWQAQVQHARRMMKADLVELVEKIESPFVSIISSISSPRAAYFDNRLFLIGDALTQLQPNTGQGTNLAAMDAMLLSDMIAGKLTPQEWEEQVLELSERERFRAIAFASKWLCTWWGRWVAEARYRWMLSRQRFWKRWGGSTYSAVKAKVQ